MANKCYADRVPDAVLDNQIDQLDKLRDECEAAGGQMTTRVKYGCTGTKLGDEKGASHTSEYNNQGTALDRLPFPDGREPTEDEIAARVRERLQNELREALKEAQEAAKRQDCGNADPAFAVQAFCKKGGSVIGNQTGNPFVVRK
jgi:hypothetical protein